MPPLNGDPPKQLSLNESTTTAQTRRSSGGAERLGPIPGRRLAVLLTTIWGHSEDLADRRRQQALFLGVKLDAESAALALGAFGSNRAGSPGCGRSCLWRGAGPRADHARDLRLRGCLPSRRARPGS